MVIGTTIIAAVMVVIVLIFGNDGGYDANGWAWIDVVSLLYRLWQASIAFACKS